MLADSNVKKQFGHLVRSLREKRAYSQDDFARRVGIDRSYISGIECGVRNPTLTMIVRIAEGLGVQTNRLFANRRQRVLTR